MTKFIDQQLVASFSFNPFCHVARDENAADHETVPYDRSVRAGDRDLAPVTVEEHVFVRFEALTRLEDVAQWTFAHGEGATVWVMMMDHVVELEPFQLLTRPSEHHLACRIDERRPPQIPSAA
jgi:hypothetical protein